jgi:starch-binding outer membrane protein, SusD/RagB family
MRISKLVGGRAFRVTAVLTLTAVLTACSADAILEVEDPDIVLPENADSEAGSLALANGTLGRLNNITAGAESTWLFGGLLVDEWSSSSTFVQNDETDQRSIQLNNSSITGMLRNLGRVRTAANQAVAGLEKWHPDTQAPLKGEMFFARAFAEMQLAQDFCNGIPLSDGSGEEPVFGSPMTVLEVFTAAVASYDLAIAKASGTDAASVRINRAAKIGKARALLGLGQHAAAAALVAGIPTSFTYQSTFATTSGDNTIWAQGLSAKRYSVADRLEGNGRNVPVGNALNFGTAADPRLPVVDTKANGQDGQTWTRTTVLYQRTTSVDIVNGIDARLIEAEAQLKAGDAAWLTTLNALRAAPPPVGSITPAAMPALADPGTADARLDLLFRERAFWTFGRGQRLGDLRRLIRQYGRTPDNTFPTGNHYKGGTYGSDVNLPIVTEEEGNNPNSPGCTDRNA